MIPCNFSRKRSNSLTVSTSPSFLKVPSLLRIVEVGNKPEDPCVLLFYKNPESIPENYFANRDPDNENYHIKYFAKPYSEITSIAHSLRAKHGYLFCGFSDMSIQEICKQTSLDENAAADAKAREATEPILWNESEARLDEFHKQLNEHGLKLTRGGRFLHIMSPVSKGQAVNWLLEQYREHLPDITWVSMALGDSENDIEMLQQVDYPVLVKNPYAVQPELSDMDKLVRTRLPGPHGWNEAVLSLISKLK